MSKKTSYGLIRISNDVISTIAGIAALATPGIASMSGSISEGLTKRFRGKNAIKGVFVEVLESEATINLHVIVNYRTNIQAVSRELQENVRESVENMTGLRVVNVNVIVESLLIEL
ncbi:Asp23/Gls24 family envelope stress response protein [Paenibacillus sp. CGMCC 1.16610]|uniref:Asp23/Gls24 family envelope stress response protein n=1 Tax=Paenibacillus anseongense TaxID=2682845 RepID=A0ABW9UJK3_9BACL|nr:MULTISPECIES: Asp23/Gls24 family envelope stress response protein [Paenibacillus]MBA2939508.1 Asp23/Gls24 family envelope stress response protein [Paenibacillus sp. CGMCC 1.16610]MVQ39171.1 Asp23/Gls24 family envelope stress response protein [Paenibacillus anseongense]